MIDDRISELPAASALTGAEVLPLQQSGTTKKRTVDFVAPMIQTVFSTSANGMVPVPPAGSGAANLVLCADGTWVSIY